MSNWKLQVIGGPLDGTISPDYGEVMRAPRPRSFAAMYVVPDHADLSVLKPMPIDQYRRYQTDDGNFVYAYEGFKP